MRIAFMGTPDFAAASLRKLLVEGFQVVGVFTQPDKPKSRGMKMLSSPVKELALNAGIPVFQPEKMRDGTALAELKALEPDIVVVVAYGRILPEDILAVPPLGTINIHGSLLPQYRGAAPIQWTVLNGDAVGGVSSMYLAKEMDAGDVIYTAETTVGEFESSGELYERLSIMGAELLCKTLRDIEVGQAPRKAQDTALVSYAPPLTKEMSPINWSKTPREIVKHICGLDPWPVATMVLGEVTLKVFSAEYTDERTQVLPGTVLKADHKAGLMLACGGGDCLYISSVQAPGGKRMSAKDYLRGHPIEL